MKKKNLHILNFLPNLLTIMSLFSGLYAISLLLSSSIQNPLFFHASIALFLAIFFDMLDGRIARLTGHLSDFGKHLDSVVDFVCFGLAPALLVYQWSLREFHLLGVVIASSFVVCSLVRLSRFNVMNNRADHAQGNDYFVGLPLPFSTGIIVSCLLFFSSFQNDLIFGKKESLVIVCVALLCSFLSVSKIRFRTFKHVSFSATNLSIGLFFLVGSIAIAVLLQNVVLNLLFLFVSYVFLGFLEQIKEHFRF